MIDTHAHLDFPEFDKDREEVISRFFETGGKAIINVGVDLERSRKSLQIAEQHEKIFAAVGFHPHEAGEKKHLPSKPEFEELKKLGGKKKIVAIGEIGLDYFYYKGKDAIELQKQLFVKQMEIAENLKLPVAIHCREAWGDLYEIISKFNKSSAFPSAPREGRSSLKPSFSKFVLHCYSGEKSDTEKFLKMQNIYFSFSGNITYPKPVGRAERLAEAVRLVPLDRIMLDSDAPFLAPQEIRGKRNEPAYVKHIAQKIAEIKGISASEVEHATDENAVNFFGLGRFVFSK